MKLNKEQQRAVDHESGPLLLDSSAGTGKTSGCIVPRVAHLINQGIPPESILLLTFTNASAKEMIYKAKAIHPDAARICGGTFHSVASKQLRLYGDMIGIGNDFAILDQEDSEGIIRDALADIPKDQKKGLTKKKIYLIISSAANKRQSIYKVVEKDYIMLKPFSGKISDVASIYKVEKKKLNALDYDDLLEEFLRLVKNPEAAKLCAWDHVLVDEYQDTNLCQAEIVRTLVESHGNIFAVGDPGQSIYSFRGAQLDNILYFSRDFQGATVINLDKNYRSTNQILRLGNQVLRGSGINKKLHSDMEGDKPELIRTWDQKEEAELVVYRIQRLIDIGVRPKEIAVLFRSSFHSYKIEMELSSKKIGFDKRGGISLASKAHIKDVVSFLRVKENDKDMIAWKRILLMIPGVGEKTARSIMFYMSENKFPIQGMKLHTPNKKSKDEYWDLVEALEDISMTDRLLQLTTDNIPINSTLGKVINYYSGMIANLYPEDYEYRMQDMERFEELAKTYTDLREFLDTVCLELPKEDEKEKIVLSTVHSAKGLEWEHVFIVGAADGLWPREQIKEEELPEEYRLLYVAATRAKEELVITWPARVQGYDRQWQDTCLSQLMADVDGQLFKS